MKTAIKISTLVIIFFALPFATLAQDKKVKEVVSEKKIVEISDIKTVNAFPEEMLSEKVKSATKSNANSAAPTDGIIYNIVSSTNTTFNDCFKCGPAVGREATCEAKYTVETRSYSEYKNNQVVRVWMNTVSVYMGCGRW